MLYYTIQPLNASGQPTSYVNWNGGVGQSHAGLGLYNSASDAGSSWAVQDPASLPVAPDVYSVEGSRKIYKLKNLRSQKYADNQTPGQRIDQLTPAGEGSYWVFEQPKSGVSQYLTPGTIAAYLYNEYVGQYLKSHSTGSNSGSAEYTAEPEQICYFTPITRGSYVGYNISKDLNRANSWNDYGSTYVCQYMGNDDGSVWDIEFDHEDKIADPEGAVYAIRNQINGRGYMVYSPDYASRPVLAGVTYTGLTDASHSLDLNNVGNGKYWFLCACFSSCGGVSRQRREEVVVVVMSVRGEKCAKEAAKTCIISRNGLPLHGRERAIR